MSKEITLTIDGKNVQATEGEYILNVARANNIFIPAVCYLTRCSPTLACRLCLVEADGKRVYACNSKVKEGMNITVDNEEISTERKAIMRVYDINHPFQCGVCDKSGECELQDNTLFMSVDSQEYTIKDIHRPTQDWGFIKYDPGLCIVCERCVTSCKDMIGDAALKTVKRGGDPLSAEYKESMPKDAYAMWNKMNKFLIGANGADNTLDCIDCGECASVCPVGALVSSDFQYKSNAWELKTIPSTCSHCSVGCQLFYETKHTSSYDKKPKIYRAKNDFHFVSLCGAGRFGYDFENQDVAKDEVAFSKAVEAFRNADTIHFSSSITNEEALILQMLKEKFGYKLINKDAYQFNKFLKSFQLGAGEVYNATVADIHKSDFLISVGTALTNDAPAVRFALNNALKINKGAGFYFHPVGEKVISGLSKTFLNLKNRVGSEEAVMYLVLDLFADKTKLPQAVVDFLASFHSVETITVKEKKKERQIQKVIEKKVDEDGNETEVEVEKPVMVDVEVEVEKEIDKNRLFELCGIREVESTELDKLLKKKENFSLIVGEDCINHPRAKEIAKLAGLIQKTTNFKVLLIPTKLNTLGVVQICKLDQTCGDRVVGYNANGSFVLNSLGANLENELDMPALNQQEGTITNIDKQLLPLNAALPYSGYALGDIANELGLDITYTVDLTSKLPQEAGYKSIEFDDLKNYYAKNGEDMRGYILDLNKTYPHSPIVAQIDESAFLKDANIYRCNPVNQFSDFTAKAHELQEETSLLANLSWISEYGLESGCNVEVVINNKKEVYKLKLDETIEANFAMLPTYNSNKEALFKSDDYRFSHASIRKV